MAERILIIDDDRAGRDGRRLPAAVGLRDHCGRHRRRGPAPAGGRLLRRRRPRRHAAGPRRLRGVPAAARRLRRAGADADRARRPRGPRRRPRARRRRLPAEAVRPPRAARPAAGDHAPPPPAAPAARRPCCASAASRSTPTRARCAWTARCARSPATSSTCSVALAERAGRVLSRETLLDRLRPRRRRGLRPLDRRARLAHPRRHRGRPEAPAPPAHRARRRLQLRPAAARTRT